MDGEGVVSPVDTGGDLVRGGRPRVLVEPSTNDILGDLVYRPELLGQFGLGRLQGVGEVGGLPVGADAVHGCGPQLLDRASNLFSGVYTIVNIDGIVHTLNTLNTLSEGGGGGRLIALVHLLPGGRVIDRSGSDIRLHSEWREKLPFLRLPRVAARAS